MTQMRGTDIGALCARRQPRWSWTRLIHELRRAARRRNLVLPENDSLKRMIRGWNSGDHGLSELYADLLGDVFGLPFTVGKPGAADTGGEVSADAPEDAVGGRGGTMADRREPRTLLEQMVQRSDRTIEEVCRLFEKRARELKEAATLSPRQLCRWMAGEVGTAHPSSRRVARELWGRPFDELLGPPDEPDQTTPTASGDALLREPTPAVHRELAGLARQMLGLLDDPDAERTGHCGMAAGYHRTGKLPTGNIDPAGGSDPTKRRDLGALTAVLAADLVIPDVASLGANIRIETIELALARIVAQQHHVSPSALVKQMERVEEALVYADRAGIPRAERRDLYRLVGKAAVVHSAAALRMGDARLARALGERGFVYAKASGDAVLCAEAVDQEGFTESYCGRAEDALDCARSGLAIVHEGPLAARLEIAVARTAAKLGDRDTALRSIDRAYRHTEKVDTAEYGEPGSFDFHPAEVFYHATIALCSIMDQKRAEGAYKEALGTLDVLELPGYQSSIRLHYATMLARGDRPDLDRSLLLAGEAMDIIGGRYESSVHKRAGTLVRALSAHRSARGKVGEITERVTDWQDNAG